MTTQRRLSSANAIHPARFYACPAEHMVECWTSCVMLLYGLQSQLSGCIDCCNYCNLPLTFVFDHQLHLCFLIMGSCLWLQ